MSLSKVILSVSNLDQNFVNKHARIPSAAKQDDIKFEVEFRPEQSMTGYEAAVSNSIIANVLARNEPMSPEEFENIPEEVARFFHKIEGTND